VKKPSPEDQARCIEIRCRAKRGEHLSKEDILWNEKIWRKYNEWYKSKERYIFKKTLPFGANPDDWPDK